MQLSEKIDITLKIVDKVDTIWDFFFMANGGVIAFLVLNGSLISIWYKAVFAIAYSLFLVAQFTKHIRAQMKTSVAN